ncbi:capsular polysaccharide biosynthesis protein [Falsirhodobacter sp. 20TX0035]|uniref:capsular polysaccharide biosynthesis protein n=1 Tax=Falsirhodobacter sp. 20TX0035 TaxID=3022019 RepID=UPI0023306E41|nr:capsular polysaccharide biosynthesis protein [Falsirhodobacter sp. 20TX0035]MDB6453661.1 capsular polysaccharide biosynthesis protein [Falsirhodobacter sp. 20TX0035]
MAAPRRLFFFNAGLLRQARLRRILSLAGHELHLGLPGPEDGVVVWGRSPYAARGEAVARRRGVPLFRLEDAFLRSVRPGRVDKDGPLGVFLDTGVHFDASQPTALEAALNAPADPALLARARTGIARLRALELSKYNDFDPDAPLPPPGFVLVVDQVKGDASLRHCGAGADVFDRMLAAARTENPGARIVIKTHPETAAGLRPGHLTGAEMIAGGSPWRLLERAARVYTVSSQLGFEAILTGHRPRVFGAPFYAGWGLSEDEIALPRRTGRPTAEHLFAAAMIQTPLWYDPCRDRLCSFEEAVDQLEAETRVWREDRHGHIATGMRLWKRGRLQAVFGRHAPLRFRPDPVRAAAEAAATGTSLLVWAGKEPPGLHAPMIRRVEDGFLRSRGLGAELVPPLSLVADDAGIYYDPTRESRLERLILAPPPPGAQERIMRLVARLTEGGLSKYNLGGNLPDLPEGHRILVPGQVEDDASLRLGGGTVRRNADLLRAARTAHPGAILVYKPHPDVEAGLRPGAIDAAEADVVATQADAMALILACDEVWTMTSLLGFEALLRGRPVTCLGAPFYAGWGLTTDLHPPPPRRAPRPLWQVAHAALITYPRYYDPVSRRPCPTEVVVDRLQQGNLPKPCMGNRLLAKAQGAFASRAHLWRQ